MSNENVHDALREMASDKSTTGKELRFMTAAVIADMAEQIGGIAERQEVQININTSVAKDLESNTKEINTLRSRGNTYDIINFLGVIAAGVVGALFGPPK